MVQKRATERTTLVQSPVCREGGGVDPLWPGAGIGPRRGGGCFAGNLRGVDADAGAAGTAGALLRARLPQPRAELPAHALATADARMGSPSGQPPLVRAVAGRRGGTGFANGHRAGIGRFARRTTRGHRPENLARLHVRGNRRPAGNFAQHGSGTLPLRLAENQRPTERNCL